MNPDFSERQFEAAINIELTTSLGPHMAPAIPIVPTTNQEARGGWDALFKLGSGYWYFLQYKIATYASRRTGWNQKIWDEHRSPYFRFGLHRDSVGECRQHRLLTELRKTQPGVYYCAPAFVKQEELWSRAANGSVLDGSSLLDLEDLSLADYWGPHHVSFDGSGLVQTWSEPGKRSRADRSPSTRRDERNRRPIDAEAIGGLFGDVSRIAAASVRGDDPEALGTWFEARLAGDARSGLDAEEEDIGVDVDLPDLIASTSRILQLDFGLTWVIEPSPPSR